jgi:isocitrate lyase
MLASYRLTQQDGLVATLVTCTFMFMTALEARFIKLVRQMGQLAWLFQAITLPTVQCASL